MVEVQHRQHAGIRPPALEVRRQVHALEHLAQGPRRQTLHPLVEVAEQHLRSLDRGVGHELGQLRRLPEALAHARAEVHVEHVEVASTDVDVHPLASARLPAPERQVTRVVAAHRQPAQDDVAVGLASQQARGLHHPAHTESGAEERGLAVLLGTAAHDLLQRDDVGVEPLEHVEDAFGPRPSIHTAALVDVVGGEAEALAVTGRAGGVWLWHDRRTNRLCQPTQSPGGRKAR